MATKIVLHGDPSISQEWTQTTIIATGGATINDKQIAVFGDSCNPYNLKSWMPTVATPTVIASSNIILNGKKIAYHNDALTPGDIITGTGL